MSSEGYRLCIDQEDNEITVGNRFSALVSGGTVLTAFNNNRNSATVSDAIIIGDPTATTVGTFIGSHVIGSTTGGASKSGGTSSVNKYQLKQNTTYLLKFIADADNTRVTQSIFWRECNS